MVRLKHRYLLVTFLYPSSLTGLPIKDSLPDILQFNQPSSDQLTVPLLIKAIREGVAELFGDYGVGVVSSSLQGRLPYQILQQIKLTNSYSSVKYLSPATSTAIIRTPRAHYQLVWAALTFITRLPKPINQPCVVRIVRVSGTIRKSEEEVIKRAKATILRAQEIPMGGEEPTRSVKSVSHTGGRSVNGRGEDVVMAIEDDEEGEDDFDSDSEG